MERGFPLAKRSSTEAAGRPSWLLTAVVSVLALAVGLGWWYTLSGRNDAPAVAVSPDTIPGAPPMPDWLKTASPLTQTEYAWAASHLKELQYIPCYCGCGGDGHTDNFSCYYRRDAAGKITGYDQMSLG